VLLALRSLVESAVATVTATVTSAGFVMFTWPVSESFSAKAIAVGATYGAVVPSVGTFTTQAISAGPAFVAIVPSTGGTFS